MTVQQLSFEAPRARTDDPRTAHEAAETVRPGNGPLVRAIRQALRVHGPLNAWEIADAVQAVHGDRWSEPSIRSACARAGLTKYEWDSLSPRGHRCVTYGLSIESVTTDERL